MYTKITYHPHILYLLYPVDSHQHTRNDLHDNCMHMNVDNQNQIDNMHSFLARIKEKQMKKTTESFTIKPTCR